MLYAVSTGVNKKNENFHSLKRFWQLWDSNPRPFGLVPKTSALDHSAILPWRLVRSALACNSRAETCKNYRILECSKRSERLLLWPWSICDRSEIRTRATEVTGALNQRLRPLGHATYIHHRQGSIFSNEVGQKHLEGVDYKVQYHHWHEFQVAVIV